MSISACPIYTVPFDVDFLAELVVERHIPPVVNECWKLRARRAAGSEALLAELVVDRHTPVGNECWKLGGTRAAGSEDPEAAFVFDEACNHSRVDFVDGKAIIWPKGRVVQRENKRK